MAVFPASGDVALLSAVGTPVVMSNSLPWHGQMIVPPSTFVAGQPW